MKKSIKDNPVFQFLGDPPPSPEQEQAPQTPEPLPGTIPPPPEGYKINPVYIELRTKHIHFVLQPSLYERIKAAAKAEGISTNEYIHRTLDQATPKTKGE